MHFVYIIESTSTGRWYYGSTSNLEARLDYHNRGWNPSTKGRRPWKVIFAKEFQIIGRAREFEVYLKKLRNKAYIKRQYREYFVNSPACPDERLANRG